MTYEPIPRERARWRRYAVTMTRSLENARRAPGIGTEVLKRVELPAMSEHGATAFARQIYEVDYWAPVHTARV